MAVGELNLRQVAGLMLCAWLIGTLVTLGAAYWYFQSQADAIHYVINRGSCSAYALIDPAIKSNDTLLLALDRSIKDPKTSPEMLKINKKRRNDVKKQQKSLRSFRTIYGTIPANYNCKRLPKHPPTGGL